MLAIRDRSRKFPLLQLIGSSRAWFRRMMRTQAAVLIALGWAIGEAGFAIALMPFARVVTGSPRPDLLQPQLAAVPVGTAVLAWLATMTLTRSAMQTRPMDAIGIAE